VAINDSNTASRGRRSVLTVLRWETILEYTPHQQRETIRRRDSGWETLADIARSYNVGHSTISRLAACAP